MTLSKNICGAKTKGKGTPCTRPAGWGTKHVGTGKCKLHGGASTGAPKGNKNAVKHGLYENIWEDQLDDEERALLANINTDKLKQIEASIKLLTIRERRIMKRIEDVKNGIVYKKHIKTTVEKKDPYGDSYETDENDNLIPRRHIIADSEKEIQTEINETNNMEILIALEDALTKVQKEKARMIELKARYEDPEDGSSALLALVKAIRGSAAEHEAEDEEAEENE